jgi:hypothetical protein
VTDVDQRGVQIDDRGSEVCQNDVRETLEGDG